MTKQTISFREYVLSEAFGSYELKRSKSEELEVASQSPLYKPYVVNDWTFRCTAHAAAQAIDRRGSWTAEQWETLHKKVLIKVMPMRTDKFSDGGRMGEKECLFFSKKLGQGYIAAVNSAKKEVRIVTVLPPNKDMPKPGTMKIMMEQIQGLERVDLD